MTDFKELFSTARIRKLPTKVKFALYFNIPLVIGTLIIFGGIYIISRQGLR